MISPVKGSRHLLRLLVATALVTAAPPAAGAAAAGECETTSHTIAAPDGFFIGDLYVLTRESHSIVGSGFVLVNQSGFAPDSGGTNAGEWFEMALMFGYNVPLRHYCGSLSTDNVHLSPAATSSIRMPYGDLGTIDLTLTPEQDSEWPVYPINILAPWNWRAHQSNGDEQHYQANIVAEAAVAVHVEGVVGDYFITNHIPEDADHGAGVITPARVAAMAEGQTSWTTSGG